MSPARNLKPHVDKSVVAILQAKDCNKARVYILWTELFDQDVQITALHRYLERNYEWTPCYKTLRERWMPAIIKAKHEVENRIPIR